MKYIQRKKSIITAKSTLEKLQEFKNFPVFIGATDQPIKKDIFADMSFSICKLSGMIQLDKLLPSEIVYSEYHSEALGGVWNEHHLAFLKFLKKYKPSKILEIGGSNGFMAKEYIKEGKVKQWIIVEPNPAIKTQGVIKVIPEMFDESFSINEKVDTIIHSHTLEHIYDPRGFLRSISNFLSIGDYHIFSIPNLYEYLVNKQSNTMNFEHTYFLTEYFADYLLEVYGFKLLEKKSFKNHSIFYACQKIKEFNKREEYIFNTNSKYKEYKKLFKLYISYCMNTVKEFNKKANTFDGEIFVFGGHVFSQLLIFLGLSDKVLGILDNSKLKQGKRLYGTKYTIYSPEILKEKKNVAIILRVGAYQNEVKRQLKSINRKIIIWE